MKHSYRTLKQWNQWLAQDVLGVQLISAEHEALAKILSQHYGKHALLIGVANQYDLLKASSMPKLSLLSPLIHDERGINYIESGLNELPLFSGSVDLVIIPHTLEFIDNPQHLLAEACRVVKPEGIIVVCGFNPISTWGVKKLFVKESDAPWVGNFIQPGTVRNWLKLSDFQMESQHSALFASAVATPDWLKRFHFIESIGNRWGSLLGGAYLIAARAKLIPLTPIKMKWKQQFSGLRLPTTITGHIVGSSYK